jgi:hypothetical protein
MIAHVKIVFELCFPDMIKILRFLNYKNRNMNRKRCIHRYQLPMCMFRHNRISPVLIL